jgi:catechol 2,3-dioxygenase-like lactoylglutathione lyase family enzyme
VHSLDHFALTVPDLAEAAAFYTIFGLDVRPEGTGAAIYTFRAPATLGCAPGRQAQAVRVSLIWDLRE